MVAQLVTVAEHTALLYLFLVLAFRLLGRREVSGLTTVELLVVAVMGSAVETSMIGGDVSLVAGFVAAATLLVLNRGLAALIRRSRRFRRLLVGRPVIVVYRGRLVHRNLRRAGLTEAEVLQGVRARGYDGIERLRLAVMEIDGSVSALPFPKDEEQKAA